MSYKLPDPPADTPRVNVKEYASDPDCYGQIGGLVDSDYAREIERDYNEMKNLALRLYKQLAYFDCDDQGQELKKEAQQLLY